MSQSLSKSSPSDAPSDGATLAFLAALGLLPGSRRSMWRTARRAFLDRVDPEARMPVGTAMMRDVDGSLVEVDLAEYRARALFLRAMDHAQHRMCLAHKERIESFLDAGHIGDEMHNALSLAEMHEAWHEAYANLPRWVQQRYGTAAAANPFERARIIAGPLAPEHAAAIAECRHTRRDEIVASMAFGRQVTELAGLDPARRRIVGRRLKADAKAARPAARA